MNEEKEKESQEIETVRVASDNGSRVHEIPQQNDDSEVIREESFSHAQSAFSKLGQEIGVKLFNLAPTDFSVFLVAGVPYASHMKGGKTVEISINALLPQDQVRFHLLESLGQVSLLKRGVSIELKSRLDDGERFVKMLNPIDQLSKDGKLMPREEVTVEYVYTARVKHRTSGIVVVKECPARTKSWSQLIFEAQVELAKIATAVGYEKLGGFKNLKKRPKPQRKLGVD